MNFSQVKSVTIPEGNVKSISIDGVTVWSAKSGGWSIDDYEVNENLIISKATSMSSSAYVGKVFIVSIKPQTAFDSTNYSAIVYDETNESLCDLIQSVMTANKAFLQIRFHALEPRAAHPYTFWLLDPDGKVSANSMSLTLEVR